MRAALNPTAQPRQDADQDVEPSAAAKLDCLRIFMNTFGVDSPLIPVSKLARILGKSKAWIYREIRAGSFFLPTKTVGDSHMIPVDALIDWYLRPQSEVGLTSSPTPLGGQAMSKVAGIEVIATVSLSDLPEFDVERLTAAARKRVEMNRKRQPS